MYLLQQEANIAVLTAEGKAWGQVGGKEEGLPFTNTLESLGKSFSAFSMLSVRQMR